RGRLRRPPRETGRGRRPEPRSRRRHARRRRLSAARLRWEQRWYSLPPPMEIRFSAEEEGVRAEARAWLAANVPATPRPTELRARAEYDRAWQRRMYDAGWAGIAWPKEYGGRGASLMEQLVWYEEYARAGAPDVSTLFVGLNHAGPTLIACGSDAQKAEHLPRILRGDGLWCQGFCGPNAGSDLASLQTRAVIDGDELAVTGQE